VQLVAALALGESLAPDLFWESELLSESASL
jgi:hypothetical protein